MNAYEPKSLVVSLLEKLLGVIQSLSICGKIIKTFSRARKSKFIKRTRSEFPDITDKLEDGYLASQECFEDILSFRDAEDYAQNLAEEKKIFIRKVAADDVFPRISWYWDNEYIFIECLTIGMLVFSAVLSILVYTLHKNIIFYLILFICSWRVIQLICMQIKTILYDTIGKNAIHLRSPRRSIILLTINIIELIFHFSTMFMLCISFSDVPFETIARSGVRWGEFLRYSTLNFLTFGYSLSDEVSSLLPKASFLLDMTFIEILLGFIVVVIALARLFSLLPDVKVQK